MLARWLWVLWLLAGLTVPTASDAAGRIDVPMQPDAWELDIGSGDPRWTARFADGIMSFTCPLAPANHYPRLSAWAKPIPALQPEHGYHLIAEVRLLSRKPFGNFLVGVNPKDAAGTEGFFHHWHFNEGARRKFYGDWQEVMVRSATPIDSRWHRCELLYDGADQLTYTLDGKVIAVQQRTTQHPLTGQQYFRVYAERHPQAGDHGPITLQVRQFSVEMFDQRTE